MRSLTQWSLDLLDVIYEGRVYEFYEHSGQNLHNIGHQYMGANFVALIPWALWNMPLWILQRWFDVEVVGHAWTLLYSKLFLLIVTGVNVFWGYKITMAVTTCKHNSLLVLYLSFSCPFTLISVLYAGQSDIISLCFFVMAVYFFICKKKLAFFYYL